MPITMHPDPATAGRHDYRVWLTGALYTAAFLSIVFLRQVLPGGDMWLRLASGRLVLEEGTVPRTDPFSFTARGASWIDHEWLAGVAMYAMYRVDYEVIIVVFALLALAPFALMHRHALKAGRAPWLPTLGIVAVAIACAWRNYPSRPTLINPLGFALLLILIDSHRRARMKGQRASPAIYTVPVVWLWANLQAGFMAGFAVLAVWVGVSFYERRDRRLALTITVASALVGLVNAYGWRLYTYTLWATVGGSADRRYIQEWLSPDFHTPLNWPHALAIVVALSFAGRKMDTFPRIILTGTVMASLLSARFQPFLAIALVFAIPPVLEPMVAPSVRLQRALSYAAAPLVALPAVFVAATVPASPSSQQPRDALDFVRREYPSERVLATIDISNWLVYEGEPVFFDGRTSQVYSNELVADYFDLHAVEGDWEATLDKYRINIMFIEPDTELGRVLTRRGWRTVFDDERATILVHPSFGLNRSHAPSPGLDCLPEMVAVGTNDDERPGAPAERAVC